MRILYVITKSNWGGAQRQVYDLALAMKAKGHEVIAAVGGNGVLKTKLDQAGIFTYSIEAMQRDMSLGREFRALGALLDIMRNKKPDVVHLHSPKAAGLGALAARLRRIPVIVQTVHGWTFNEPRPLIQRGLIRFFSWLTMILCTRTVLISERDYTQALFFPWVKHKLSLVNPGFRPSMLMSVDGAKQHVSTLAALDISKKIVVGTIAELHPNKGLMFLLEAMSQVVTEQPNIVCLIIGDGEQSADLHMRIKEKGLEGNVRMLGFQEDAAQYLKAFTMFVLPSVKEGLPYVILEAGHANIPVVATTVGGIPEIIEDMKSGILVQPRSARELAHAIVFMATHADERRKCAAALREHVIGTYSFDGMLHGLEHIYNGQDPAEHITPSSSPTISTAPISAQ